jgi:protein involved in polysaccharide export with SLBB domain
VRYPGRYALRTKVERLNDLIQRAGGLTSEGYADGVVFYRSSERTGRIGLDLPGVLRNPRNRDNFVLKAGDSVVVPVYNPVVRVDGAVNAPVAVAYVPGERIDYYIRAAGGPAQNADMGRAYVTQPNGKVESVSRHTFAPDILPKPRAGSTVNVPARTSPSRDLAQVVTLIGQIAGTLSALVLAIVTIKRSAASAA